MTEKPKASSTPKIVEVIGRKRIGDSNNDTVQSPIGANTYGIVTRSSKKFVESERKSGWIPESVQRGKKSNVRQSESDHNQSEISDSDSNEECIKESIEEYIKESARDDEFTNKSFGNCISPITIMVVVFIGCLMGYLFLYPVVDSDPNLIEPTDFTKLSQEFPSQAEDFWLSLQVALKEIKRFNQPRTFLFLYQEGTENTVNSILNKVSQASVCFLTNCSQHTVILDSSDLNTDDYMEDYGRVINRNKEKLEESGVMIVRNLEKVTGRTAQALHSFCDEYNPVVKRAIFLFTVKVKRFDNNNVRYVEKILHEHWSDITDDKFYPLFTRLSTYVLPIVVE